ncbi:MAG: barstar family protein [Andreesenia angusta]|nr:barstar family protein [Andreesenia angusta]
MKTIVLNINRFDNMIEVHEYLKKKFNFPEYYGKNLDALYDCLTSLKGEYNIVIKNRDDRNIISESDIDSLISVFNSVKRKNNEFYISIV